MLAKREARAELVQKEIKIRSGDGASQKRDAEEAKGDAGRDRAERRN